MTAEEGVTFFRTTENEASASPGLALTARLEGVPLYVHESLAEHFAARPLILTTRGPRLALEKDEALARLEAALLRGLAGSNEDS